MALTPKTTKIKFSIEELSTMRISIINDETDKYNGATSKDKPLFEDYQSNTKIIIRIERALARCGVEVTNPTELLKFKEFIQTYGDKR